MSEIARWTYTNTATIRPFLERDKWGNNTYGPEYEIACTWRAKSMQATTPAGVEFVSRHIVYCEDPRPKYLDMIRLNGGIEWEEIKSHAGDDMSFFDDVPDYTLTTG